MPICLSVWTKNFKAVSDYADAIREAAAEALPEQSILVVVHEIYHSN